ncbi:MAG: hypothetical protein HY815_12775 [Candidatus Riflebacteria bacterium]|nr:hypothetical protein [Candidatus Riflebacteria bacterium]
MSVLIDELLVTAQQLGLKEADVRELLDERIGERRKTPSAGAPEGERA